jgi:hypothetical protein
VHPNVLRLGDWAAPCPLLCGGRAAVHVSISRGENAARNSREALAGQTRRRRRRVVGYLPAGCGMA